MTSELGHCLVFLTERLIDITPELDESGVGLVVPRECCHATDPTLYRGIRGEVAEPELDRGRPAPGLRDLLIRGEIREGGAVAGEERRFAEPCFDDSKEFTDLFDSAVIAEVETKIRPHERRKEAQCKFTCVLVVPVQILVDLGTRTGAIKARPMHALHFAPWHVSPVLVDKGHTSRVCCINNTK